MPNDEVIITNPRPKLALRPTGVVAHWREVWKEWSTWLLGIALFVPDIMNAMIQQGWVSPSDTPLAFRIMVGMTFLAKFVNQKKPDPQ